MILSHSPSVDPKHNVPSFPKKSGSLIPTPQPWPLNISGISKLTLCMPQRTGNLCLRIPQKRFPKVQLDKVFTGSLQRTIQQASTDHVKPSLLISEWWHWQVKREVKILHRNCVFLSISLPNLVEVNLRISTKCIAKTQITSLNTVSQRL